MDNRTVEFQTFGILSRVAAGKVHYGRVVQRHSSGKVEELGGTVLDMCQVGFTPVAGSVSIQTGGPMGNFVRHAAGTNTGMLMYKNISAANWGSYKGMSLLVRSSINLAAGDLKLAFSETGSLGGSPVEYAAPAMLANEWYLFSIAMTGLSTERDAVLSYGYSCSNATSKNIDFGFYGLQGEVGYDIAGFANSDKVARGDVCDTTDVEAPNYYKAGQDIEVIPAGILNGVLYDTVGNVVAGQKLYPLPQGKLTTTPINNSFRDIVATDDMATAGGRVEVLI